MIHPAPATIGTVLMLWPALAAGQTRGPDPTAPPPRLPEAVHSMGQPPLIKPYLAGEFTWNREGDDRTGGLGVLGLYKDLVLPVSGGLGLSAEGYFGGKGGDWDGGARLFLTSRLLFLNIGVDWNAQDEKTDFILAFTPYFKRGGLFGTGGNFRVEWIPGRNHSFNVGFQIPLEPHMGETRPVETQARLPKPPKPRTPAAVPQAALEAISDLRHSGRWLVANANFFNDDDDASYFGAMEKFRARARQAKARFDATDARHPQGQSFALEGRHYHESFDAAFAAAVGPALGPEVSRRAREALLEEVLIPYNRLLGQFKKPKTLLGLGEAARVRFAQSLDALPGVDSDERTAALGTFDLVLQLFEQARQTINALWAGDERDVWIPLDLVLRPEDHDTQRELDAVIERFLGRSFARGNAVFPTSGATFQLELVRAIRSARDYHVLWIHDFAGRVDGKPDTIAHAVSVEYLKALAARVREFDETGRLPTFMIFHTQFFYEGSGSRLFLSLLEDPLHHHLKLGRGFEDMEARVRDAQEELRAAVAGSRRLQAEARERGGEGWIRKVVKVHVSVTYPADLSFRTPRLVGFLPFAPDSLMLDHRKLFFYDITEEDPGRGQALFTGTGVGQEYAGPTWDDRGIVVEGAALVELKNAARRLLRSQGFAEDEIPSALQPRPLAADYDARVASREAEGYVARGLVANNTVGFGPKEATVTQAILYTLAPPGTVIIVPDSIWASPLWAGQLAGAALRGCHVYPIAPSQDNAPAAGLPILARTREIFARLFEVSRIFQDDIAAAGGTLRVGLYTRAAPSGDTLAAAREMAAGLRRHPFLLDEIPMPPGVLALLDAKGDELAAQGFEPHFISAGTREGRPKVHRKTQLFATREALRAVVNEPEAPELLKAYIDIVAEASADPRKVLAQSPLGPAGPIMKRYAADPPEAVRNALGYLTVGSKNQDNRSAFLDGEVSFVVAGVGTLAYYIDFLGVVAETTWIERPEQLNELINVDEEKARRLGRMIRKVL